MGDVARQLPPARFLSRLEAADYLGVSADTFAREIASGLWPQGRPRGEKGGKLTWDRVLLDRAADGWSGLLTEATPAAEAEEERGVAEFKRRIYAQAEDKRSKRRHQATG